MDTEQPVRLTQKNVLVFFLRIKPSKQLPSCPVQHQWDYLPHKGTVHSAPEMHTVWQQGK